MKEQSHRRADRLAWSHPSVWEKGTFGIELFYFQWNRSELNLKLIRQVNELNWLYFIREVTQPTAAIEKYQSLPCSFLLLTWGLGSGDAVGACPPPGSRAHWHG